jgi:ubiquinone/menaquinone biosynthesis C-methylase UbiE
VEDIPFYVEYAKKSGGPVLELGCGTGRALIPIAKAGIEIWGLDISKSMLEIAKKEVDTK